MKLKPSERSSIMAGEHPQIARAYCKGQPCPFVKGEVTVLHSQRTMGEPAPLVSITILGHNRTKKGAWLAEYSVRDDRGLYLAKGPGYTRSRSGSLDPDAAVEDPGTLKRYAAQGRLRRAEHAEETKRHEKLLRERLRSTLKGLGPEAQTALLANLEREIQKAQMQAKSPSSQVA